MKTAHRTAGRRTILAVCALSLLVAAEAAAQPNVAVRWNEAMLQAVRNTGFSPCSRRARWRRAHLHVRRLGRLRPVAVGPQYGAAAAAARAEHTLANKERAMSYAAYRALVDLFPTRRRCSTAHEAELGFDPADASTDPRPRPAIGNITAAAVLAFRHGDGSNQLGD